MGLTDSTNSRDNRPIQALGWGVTLAFFALYLVTLCPTVFWYDSAEYATAAYVLGIPHPPGYPLYTLIGHIFTWLPVEPALALNLMSALFGAGTVGLAFLVGRQLGARPLASACGASTLGAGHVFWNQCVIAEVYAPGLFVLLLVLLLVLRGLRRDSLFTLVAAAGLAGLGLGIHLFIATCGLGLALFVLGIGLDTEIATPRDLSRMLTTTNLSRRLTAMVLCLIAVLIGSCIYLYVPLRAAMNPPLNFENPSTWERFGWFVTGGNYKGWFMHHYPVWLRVVQVSGIFYEQLLVVGIVLAALGLVRLATARPLALPSLLLMIGGNIYFFFNYAVHDIEVFFLPSVALLSILAGLGTEHAWSWIERHSRRTLPRRLGHIALLLFPVSLIAANYRSVDLSHYTAAWDYGDQVCRQLPHGAVVLNFTTPPEWKNNAVFANYFQIVLNRRTDVRVVTPRVPADVTRLLRQHPVFAYYPVPRLVGTFTLAKQGALYRVLGPRTGD